MNKQVKKYAWKITITFLSVMTATLIKKALSKGWTSLKHREPPKNPASRQTPWNDAILYAIVTGILSSIGKLLVRRLAYGGWETTLGESPDELD